ncbi:phage portal protein [Streptobacillus moniliformis]|uniref:phage portal protein n=1 Tax=Streptobacillus moniliformis TaxID=34105 RepID=UPI0007E41896|nr:phage portal protein [Streptobacillus moniliformis]
MLNKVLNFFRTKEKIEEMTILDEVLYILQNDYDNMVRIQEMTLADRYYSGDHDIKNKKRTMYDTKLRQVVEMKTLPCNKIIDNKFQLIIDQKTNYLVSKKPTITSNNEEYNEELAKIFEEDFYHTLYLMVKNIYLYGVAWLYIYYNEKGDLKFDLFDSKEIIPIWEDNNHEKLKFAIRKYGTKVFENKKYVEKTIVEVYTYVGMSKYEYDRGKLHLIDKQNYFTIGEKGYNWEKLPLIFFKNKHIELPLIRNVKSMQDSLNKAVSSYLDRVEQDEGSSVIVLKGFQGQNLRDFRGNLVETGAINVGDNGDVTTLNLSVNEKVFESAIRIAKTGIYETTNTFDSKNEMLGHDPNSMNIQSMYSTIDLDANETERELKKRFKTIIWFVNRYLENKGLPNYDNEEVTVIFDRDIMVNEGQVIDLLLKSQGMLSREKLIEEHPLVTNPKEELARLEKELHELDIVNDGYFNHYEDKKGADKKKSVDVDE